MKQRRNIIYRDKKLIIYIFLFSFLIINVFFFQFILNLINQNAIFLINEKLLIFITFSTWFIILFLLFLEINDNKFFGFICRIDQEIKELTLEERTHIFIRKDTPWINDKFNLNLYDMLEKNKELERFLISKSDTFKTLLKANKQEGIKILSEEIKNYITKKKNECNI
ncbi:MAG: hypothetical protein ACD_79C00596G0005 [uncultured bacterium]|nr:MAG: hypothetical protein ACD_79C00596G0005 [uncultured bacterium]